MTLPLARARASAVTVPDTVSVTANRDGPMRCDTAEYKRTIVSGLALAGGHRDRDPDPLRAPSVTASHSSSKLEPDSERCCTRSPQANLNPSLHSLFNYPSRDLGLDSGLKAAAEPRRASLAFAFSGLRLSEAQSGSHAPPVPGPGPRCQPEPASEESHDITSQCQ
eukprot:3753092-Rhodomonas_salina.1